MAKRVLIELAQNGYAVRYGSLHSLADAPLHLVATWSELLELLDKYLDETPTVSFGERDSFPVLDALGQPMTALERRQRADAPTIRTDK